MPCSLRLPFRRRERRALDQRVRWYLDANTWGGAVSERLLAVINRGPNLSCGLVFTFDGPSAPRIAFWERLDDLEKQGFVPIGPVRARAICDVLPRFLDCLEQQPERECA